MHGHAPWRPAPAARIGEHAQSAASGVGDSRCREAFRPRLKSTPRLYGGAPVRGERALMRSRPRADPDNEIKDGAIVVYANRADEAMTSPTKMAAELRVADRSICSRQWRNDTRANCRRV